MSPKNNNKHGDTPGRAAPGVAKHRDAARAEDRRVFARCLALLALLIGILVVSAPRLWPSLFAS